MPIVIGFDVSLLRTGVAVLRDNVLIAHDVIEVQPEARVAQLHYIATRTSEILDLHMPELIAVETAALWQREGHDSSKTIVGLAEARAAILVAAARYRREWNLQLVIVEMGVHEVRDLLCGNRTASKEQVQANLKMRGFVLPMRVVRKRIGGHLQEQSIVDDDVADAVAIAVAAAAKAKWGEFTKEGVRLER